ncbi:hypothetical protein NIES2101_26670 [Calothrix sp. HK-06]|nr:hypothetical protein NIES2101_26670 [Calothrix sp. HK-06]
MSLTKELSNPSSPVSKWFAKKYHKGVEYIIYNHNKVMSQSSTITPVEGTNFSLVGNAITYAFHKFIASKQQNKYWLDNTLAGKTLTRLNLANLNKLCCVNSKSSEEEAFKMLLLGAFEGYYRSYKPDTIIQPFFKGDGRNFKVSEEYIAQWRPSIDDVSNISAALPKVWCSIEHLINIEKSVVSNATFGLSSILHADCQMVIDSTIIDIRTTAKRQPFTLNNFYQQIAYLLYDTENVYKINQLAWVYTRQQVAFSYQIDQLFKNLEATRADFKEMIATNYHENRIKKHILQNQNSLIQL